MKMERDPRVPLPGPSENFSALSAELLSINAEIRDVWLSLWAASTGSTDNPCSLSRELDTLFDRRNRITDQMKTLFFD